MSRRLRMVSRLVRRAHRLAFVSALLVAPALADVAAAPPPTFQGTFTSAALCNPRGIGLAPTGAVFVGSDCGAPQHIEQFTGAGGLLTSWSVPGGPPNGIAVDGAGNVFITDYDGCRVHKCTSAGVLLTTWGSIGTGPGQFSLPVDIAVNSAGEVFVTELNGRRVQKFTNGGAYLATIGTAAQYQFPVGLALDASGRIYVADAGGQIVRFLANGSFDMSFASPGLLGDVAVGPDGNVYVTHFDTGLVYQHAPSGALLQTFTSPSGLAGPYKMVIDSAGTIYITEQSGNRVAKFQIAQATAASHTTFGRLKALYR